MGGDWVGVELLYNSVHRKFNQFGDQESWRNDAVEKTAPSRELGPRASGWATLENEKDTLLCPEELGRSICCSSVRSPTPSHSQPFQIKWEVYFYKNSIARLYCVVVMILHAYVDVYVLCVCIVGYGYITLCTHIAFEYMILLVCLASP